MRNKWTTTGVVALLAVALLAVPVAMGGNVIESWENGEPDGWSNETGMAAFDTAEKCASLSFPEKSQTGGFPPMDNDRLLTEGDSSVIPVGNYPESNVVGVGLRLRATYQNPAQCYLMIANTVIGVEWRYDLPVPTDLDWATITVPLKYENKAQFAGDWSNKPFVEYDTDDAKYGAFSNALASVAQIGVNVERGLYAEQSYQIDDFMLLCGSDYDKVKDLYAYMLAAGTVDAAQDSDADGVTDAGEYVGGTDAMDPESKIRITAVGLDEAGKTFVRWMSKAGTTYYVWKAASPAGPYNLLETVAGAASETTATDYESAGQPAYYRVTYDDSL